MNLQENIRRILKEEDRYDDKVGKTFWFEYHCYESPESCDAEIWYRSHQKVKVIGVSEWSYDDKEWRQEDGNPRVYLVEWEDGFQYDVFEDELMESPNEFYRPSPPKRKIQESIRRILKEETNPKRDSLLNIIKQTGLYYFTKDTGLSYNDIYHSIGELPKEIKIQYLKDVISDLQQTPNELDLTFITGSIPLYENDDWQMVYVEYLTNEDDILRVHLATFGDEGDHDHFNTINEDDIDYDTLDTLVNELSEKLQHKRN